MHLARFLIVGVFLSLAALPAIADDLLAIRGATIETVGPKGRLENATLLVRGGKIEAVGTDVSIPISARVIEGKGLTIVPGVVDPYFAVSIGRSSQPSETRTVTIQGRTFTVGGGSPAISTAFAKIATGINLVDIDWTPARRTGLTHLHLVAPGYCQSAIARSTDDLAVIEKPEGVLLVSVTNDTRSLDVLRNGLREPRSSGGAGGSSTSSAAGAMAGRGGGRGGPTPPSASGGGSPPPAGASASRGTDLWKPIRDGEQSLFVNVNNAAAILHTIAATQETPKAKLVIVASGADIFRVLDQLDAEKHTVILAPRVETIPNSQNLVNVPKLLTEKKVPFVFSTSLGQSEFRAQQDAPLFAVSLLVRGGLPADVALQSLTLGPAKLLGIEKEVGSLEVGKQANFLILNDAPFNATTAVQSVYVEGKPVHEN